MNVKELNALYNKLDNRLLALETAIINHTGIHKLDRIIQVTGIFLMITVILMLKFKIL